MEKNIMNLYGEKAQQWLATLPKLVEQAVIAQKINMRWPIE